MSKFGDKIKSVFQRFMGDQEYAFLMSFFYCPISLKMLFMTKAARKKVQRSAIGWEI